MLCLRKILRVPTFLCNARQLQKKGRILSSVKTLQANCEYGTRKVFEARRSIYSGNWRLQNESPAMLCYVSGDATRKNRIEAAGGEAAEKRESLFPGLMQAGVAFHAITMGSETEPRGSTLPGPVSKARSAAYREASTKPEDMSQLCSLTRGRPRTGSCLLFSGSLQ